RVLIGRSFDSDNDHNGGRVTAGYWLDRAHCVGLEGSFFAFETTSGAATVSSPGTARSPVLTRPFINVLAAREAAHPIPPPTLTAGTAILSEPQRFFGAEANVRLVCPPSIFGFAQFALLVGGRYLSLDEKLLVSESLVDLPLPGVPGTVSFLGE